MIYIYITNYVIFSETPMNSTCEGAMVIPARARLRVRAWEGQLHALGGLQGRVTHSRLEMGHLYGTQHIFDGKFITGWWFQPS